MKINHLLCILATSIITIVACSDNDSNEVYDHEVRFSVLKGEVVPDNKGWLANDAIGVYMYKVGTTTIESDAENREYKTNGEGIFTASRPDQIIYYPPNGVPVDFVAYYPYKKEVNNFLVDVDLRDQKSQQDIDLLYSNNAKNGSLNNAVENLAFSHQLTKLVFHIKAGNGLQASDLVGLKVKVHGTNSTAKFSILDGGISSQDNNEVIEIATSPTGIMSEAILLPTQTPVSTEREVTFETSIGTFTWKIPESEIFERGTRYTYNATINKTSLVVLQAEITPWTTNDPVEGGTSLRYKVGDYFPDAENPETAIGVVFWIRPGSSNRDGQIVSLKESETTLQWCTTSGGELTKAQHRGKGAPNMATIKSINPELDRFPVFKWANDLGEGWFVPARFELYSLYTAWSYDHDYFNDRLISAGGDPINSTDNFWTATEYSVSNSKRDAEYFNFTTILYPNSQKISKYKVRAIKTF